MFAARSDKRVATALMVVALAITSGAVAASWLGFRWWQAANTTHWTVQVTNQRSAELLVAGIHGAMNEGTGYTVLDAGASARAEVSDQGAPPAFVIFDFGSHKGPHGELIVVPSWQAYRKDISCTWDEVQRYQPLVVTENASSCADLAGR